MVRREISGGYPSPHGALRNVEMFRHGLDGAHGGSIAAKSAALSHACAAAVGALPAPFVGPSGAGGHGAHVPDMHTVAVDVAVAYALLTASRAAWRASSSTKRLNITWGSGTPRSRNVMDSALCLSQSLKNGRGKAGAHMEKKSAPYRRNVIPA